jgi:hypothetical protein
MVSKGSEGIARWRKDSKELYYITADVSIMAVNVTVTPVFNAGVPRLLCQAGPRNERNSTALDVPA